MTAGFPEFGKDFASDEMFLTDVNYDALNAVSYKKGCFIGQEVTSRMKRKGGSAAGR
ncbi:MAG: tRNA-modifying protein YgfZ [Parvularculaceae bacterium]